MGHKYAEIMFTDAVKNVQQQQRSRDNYTRMEQGEDYNYLLSEVEAEFISERDSFYMASVSEADWPYVQHRGGPAGFMKVLDAKTLGFADFSGNRQYISTGNFTYNNRVSLFFMDYPNRRRLKLLGRVEVLGQEHHEHLELLKPQHYRAKIERGFIIHVEAFDWNCPQHITPRYTEDEIENLVQQRIASNDYSQQVPSVFGNGNLSLIITGIRQLTPTVRAYELRSANGDQLPNITAGSHIKMPITLNDGSKTHRHYSICSNPARRDIYEIAVQIKAHSSGGSAAIHQQYQLSTQLNCALPANYFDMHIEKQQPVILIAGGIGITPIKAIAQLLIENGNPVHLHYAGRSLNTMAFADRLQRVLGENISLYPADQQPRLNLQQLIEQAPTNAIFYACGPEKLLQTLSQITTKVNIDKSRVRIERFNYQQHADDQAITVTIASTSQLIQVAADQSVLDALIDAGVNANYSCKTGQCKQCVVDVIDGEVDHRDVVLSTVEQKTQFCPCVSRSKTKYLTINM
ncbi:pyridoxamine 5'-phosphate oxidase family protein [Dasania marina]|uniref:2Fe-2S iron-sulfur cluster-binding protein n=1 Tax=Dasania marina TaxID=471499 RepID=UPI0030D7E66A|tara:strand:- start:42225 stop:43778 length:1554 start_codon:yes stop_codon:yes gene_type:complete